MFPISLAGDFDDNHPGLRLGEFTFPRGWFMVADAQELRDTPLALRFFGRDLVLYRGKASGKPAPLDAYCPHMGTHLGTNTTSYIVRDGVHIDGDVIRCPYHGWRLSGRAFARHTAALVRERAGLLQWRSLQGGRPCFAHPSSPPARCF